MNQYDDDPEERSYRCKLLQFYGQATLLSLKQQTETDEMDQLKISLYKSLNEMLDKTNSDSYKGIIAEHFVNFTIEKQAQEESEETVIIDMVGMHLLLQHMAGSQKGLRDEALKITAQFMLSNSGVCIQLLKVNLISNLILSVLRDDPSSEVLV